jgi:formate-dependent nitrite reductase cytochrome c552 subunit
LVAVGLLALTLGAYALVESKRGRARATAPPSSSASATNREGYSNIERRDYVGPDACAECHDNRYRQWRGNLHRSMNQLADADAIVGDFDSAELRYAGGSARFENAAGKFTMAITGTDRQTRRFRVTRTIGSRYLQEYVGLMVEGPEPVGHALYSTEVRLPFGYWLRKDAWFHQQYFDSWYPAEYLDSGTLAIDPFKVDSEPWATRCAWCHNTYAFELRAVRASGDQPIGTGSEQFFELATGALDPAQKRAIKEDNLLPVSELVTVGISCESCHLGGREHAREDKDIRFAPTNERLALRTDAPSLRGGRENNLLLNTVCAQCHSTPANRFPNGGAKRNSSEALDMAAGDCMSQIRCVDCHDPHPKGLSAGSPQQQAHLSACTGCHQILAEPEQALEHSGHGAGDATCLDCHMPSIVEGVSGVVRSHRISSPTSTSMLAAAAPNACNLCHIDRSIRWTAAELEKASGEAMPVEDWLDAYGDLDRPVGLVWLDSDDQTTVSAAAAAYGRADERGGLVALVERLDRPVAYYRMRMLFAIEDVLGRQLSAAEYEPTAPPAQRARQHERLLERAKGGEL